MGWVWCVGEGWGWLVRSRGWAFIESLRLADNNIYLSVINRHETLFGHSYPSPFKPSTLKDRFIVSLSFSRGVEYEVATNPLTY